MPAEIGPRFRAAFQHEEAFDQQRSWRTSEERERQRWRRIVASVLDDVTDPEACFSELFEHFGRPEAWHCDPEVVHLFPELARRGYTLGLASNFDHRLHRVLGGLALPFLQHVVVSSEIGWRKPAMKFFLELSRLTGSDVDQIVYVGDDRGNDYDGARAAGLRAILFDPQGKLTGIGAPRIARLSQFL
jgi:putative hydrolase of the HAD superfamily